MAKIECHSGEEAGPTLMVIITDGNWGSYTSFFSKPLTVTREYVYGYFSWHEITAWQVLFFLEQKSKSFVAEDPAEPEFASFTLGKGQADWDPLTVHVVTRSGAVYAIYPRTRKQLDFQIHFR